MPVFRSSARPGAGSSTSLFPAHINDLRTGDFESVVVQRASARGQISSSDLDQEECRHEKHDVGSVREACQLRSGAGCGAADLAGVPARAERVF